MIGFVVTNRWFDFFMVMIQVLAGGVLAGLIAYWAVKTGARVALEQERERRAFELEQDRQRLARERREDAARAVRDGIRRLREVLRIVIVNTRTFVESQGELRTVTRDWLSSAHESLKDGRVEFEAALHDHDRALWGTAVSEPLRDVRYCMMIAVPIMGGYLGAAVDGIADPYLARLADALSDVDHTCMRIERSLDELVRGNDAPEVESVINGKRFAETVHGKSEGEDEWEDE